eukprot:scaffold17146_cov110-Isochrysis_galbana.AAC.7
MKKDVAVVRVQQLKIERAPPAARWERRASAASPSSTTATAAIPARSPCIGCRTNSLRGKDRAAGGLFWGMVRGVRRAIARTVQPAVISGDMGAETASGGAEGRLGRRRVPALVVLVQPEGRLEPLARVPHHSHDARPPDPCRTHQRRQRKRRRRLGANPACADGGVVRAECGRPAHLPHGAVALVVPRRPRLSIFGQLCRLARAVRIGPRRVEAPRKRRVELEGVRAGGHQRLIRLRLAEAGGPLLGPPRVPPVVEAGCAHVGAAGPFERRHQRLIEERVPAAQEEDPRHAPAGGVGVGAGRGRRQNAR